MKKFWICNQQEEELFETSSGRFNCGILELFDVFVVKVSTLEDNSVVSYAAGIYHDVQEAVSTAIMQTADRDTLETVTQSLTTIRDQLEARSCHGDKRKDACLDYPREV